MPAPKTWMLAAISAALVFAAPLWGQTKSNPGIVPSVTRIGPAELTEPDPASWLSYGRTYDEQRFSPLDQINRENVSRLGLAWTYDTHGNRKHEATPLVADGVIYLTSPWSVVHALDAVTGNEFWTFNPEVPPQTARHACCGVVNRGVALWGRHLFVGTLDGRLIKLARATGDVVWSRVTVDQSFPYTITGAPRVVDGKVIIGNGGAEYGVRGYVSAYSAKSGALLWRFWTVPGNPAKPFEHPELQEAAKTWRGEWWKVGGGGTVWDSMAYDSRLNLLYVGTGNGSPWSRSHRSPGGGDNLFLSSILALNPDTGRLVWHYQTTPGDNWDYTATQHIILADIEVDGQERSVLLQAPKNGFFYVLDRKTGELLSANNFATTTWASHVDMNTSRPVETKGNYDDDARLVWPSAGGAHNWHPMAYHPGTGLVYIPVSDGPMVYRLPERLNFQTGVWNLGVQLRLKDLQLSDQAPPRTWYLSAWDPRKNEERWRVPQTPGATHGGMLVTAGGLLFQGNTSGELRAFDASSGDSLWQIDTGVPLIAPPVTFEVSGKQYLTIVGGSTEQGAKLAGRASVGRVFTFTLDANRQIPDVPMHQRPQGEIPQPFGSKEQIEQGFELYFRYCGSCHGAGAIARGTAIPDLRYATSSVHGAWNGIVLGGAYSARGMPSFGDVMTEAQAQSVRAFVVARAQERESQ